VYTFAGVMIPMSRYNKNESKFATSTKGSMFERAAARKSQKITPIIPP
jgi:hypothetical protein